MSTMQDLPDSVKVLDRGATENYDDSGSVATLRFEVPNADRERFLQVVSGLPEEVHYGNVTATRLVPLKHPDVYNCYAAGIRGGPPDGAVSSPTPNGGIGFDFYWFDVTFTTPTFAYDGDEPMITVQRDAASEMVSRPGTAYKFPSDDTRLPQPVGVPVQTTDYMLTFHRLPSLDHDLYDAFAGCVSNAEFRGKPAGTWLYLGCGSAGQKTLGGNVSFEANHRFQYRSVGWQKVMRPDGSGFEAPIQSLPSSPGEGTAGEETGIDDSGGFIHPEADLNLLFGS